MGLNEGLTLNYFDREELEDRLQKESNLNPEVIRYYYTKFNDIVDDTTDVRNVSWDEIKRSVDSYNDQITNGGDVEKNFVDAFNLVLDNYTKFNCGYIWDDEEKNIQDALTVVSNLVMKNPDLLSLVSKNKLYDNLKFMVKTLYDKTSIILYRVLFVKSLDHINYDNLGTHWTWTRKAYSRGTIQYLYDCAKNDEYEVTPNDLYIIKALTPIDNISFPATLWAQICFGEGEHEITLSNTAGLRILKSKHFKIPESWDIN